MVDVNTFFNLFSFRSVRLRPGWYLSSGRFALVPPLALFTLAPAYKEFDLHMIFYMFLAALQAIIFPSEEVLIDISY